MLTGDSIINTIEFRLLNKNEDLYELTALLNRSYKSLADLGFRYQASFQDVMITKKRVEKASCIVVFEEGKLIGTISYYSPSNARGNDWYDLEDVAYFGQFAVDPAYQGKGIGNELINRAEELALKDSAKELALDTAEGAKGLIEYYIKRGYREVGHIQWKEANYRSVLLSKRLIQG
jgi:GNAT superfamily N-acetyltransferase